jgi:hypothetical protein
MKKILIALLILIVTMLLVWVFDGRQSSSFVDRFKMAKVESIAIHSISYEGSGDGGTLMIDATHPLDLAPLNPHVGTNKENELALANAGKVFAFGTMRSAENSRLVAEAQAGDTASLALYESFLPWPNLKFMTNHLPVLQRHRYRQLIWTKANGAKLEMLWQFEEHFDPDMAPPDYEIAPLIRVEISNASR